jgi:hypothetical protein
MIECEVQGPGCTAYKKKSPLKKKASLSSRIIKLRHALGAITNLDYSYIHEARFLRPYDIAIEALKVDDKKEKK